MEKQNLPVGVFDSGVGGVSVLRELVKAMPNEDFIYLGDTKNAPYGTKQSSEIKKVALECASFLVERGIKALVVACNTATSVCIKDLRALYTDIPIVGIEPAIKPAIKEKSNKYVGVMATPLTLKGQKIRTLIDSLRSRSRIISIPCPGLMEIVEDGLYNSKEAYDYLETLFSKTPKFDALVLGCTHYPFLKATIKKLRPDVKIYDGGEGTARQLKKLLEQADLITDSTVDGKIEFINTLGSEEQNALALKLLHDDI